MSSFVRFFADSASRRRVRAVLAAFLASLAVSGCALGFRKEQPETTAPGSTPDTMPVHIPVPDTTAPEQSSSQDTSAAKPVETTPPATQPPLTEPPTTEPPVTEPPVTAPPTTESPVTEPPVTEPPVTEPPETAAPSVEVAASPAVEDSYFDDAVFIGDSRTVGLSLYSGLKTNYYSEQGLNVSSVQKKAFIPSGDDKLTLSDALDANADFKKVYLSFGINEIGWSSTDSFISTYADLVDLVQEKLPGASVCIQSILPMTKETAENDRYKPMGGNGKVAEYNERLYKLCEEKGLYYINLNEIFADSNGNLSVSDSGDGIHLGVASSRAWADYLRTHTPPVVSFTK